MKFVLSGSWFISSANLDNVAKEILKWSFWFGLNRTRQMLRQMKLISSRVLLLTRRATNHIPNGTWTNERKERCPIISCEWLTCFFCKSLDAFILTFFIKWPRQACTTVISKSRLVAIRCTIRQHRSIYRSIVSSWLNTCIPAIRKTTARSLCIIGGLGNGFENPYTCLYFSMKQWSSWQHAQKCRLLGMTTKVKYSKFRKLTFFAFLFLVLDEIKVGKVEGRV